MPIHSATHLPSLPSSQNGYLDLGRSHRGSVSCRSTLDDPELEEMVTQMEEAVRGWRRKRGGGDEEGEGKEEETRGGGAKRVRE